MLMPPDRELEQEAKWIHNSLFSSACPTEIQTLYVEAHHFFQREIDPSLCLWIRNAVRQRLSPVSLEYFMRFKDPGNPLSKKIKLLLYFCELDPIYETKFKNSEERRFSSYLILAGLGLTSAIRLASGAISYFLFLKRRSSE